MIYWKKGQPQGIAPTIIENNIPDELLP